MASDGSTRDLEAELSEITAELAVQRNRANMLQTIVQEAMSLLDEEQFARLASKMDELDGRDEPDGST